MGGTGIGMDRTKGAVGCGRAVIEKVGLNTFSGIVSKSSVVYKHSWIRPELCA